MPSFPFGFYPIFRSKPGMLSLTDLSRSTPKTRRQAGFICSFCHSVLKNSSFTSYTKGDSLVLLSLRSRSRSRSPSNSFRKLSSDTERQFHKDPVSRYLKGNVINGTLIAKAIKQEIKAEINDMIIPGTSQRLPHLSVIRVGNDPASIVYVRNKAKAAQETGITSDVICLPDHISEKDLKKEVQQLNNNSTVDGILIQLPLPIHINERTICDSVLPQKDVDGFHVLNVGRFCVDQSAFIPATPSGILEIIRRLKISTKGKNAVICGRSKNVGLPVALHLHSAGKDFNTGDATITICHRHTPFEVLKFQIQNADILVTATGVPGLITADMIKEGAIVIDIGITRIQDEQGKRRLVGDVDFEGNFTDKKGRSIYDVKNKAGLITPVPGGVGPVTVAMVLKNTLIAYRKEIDFNTMMT